MGFRLKSPPRDEAREATGVALRYLTRRDRTEHEIRVYLLRKGFPSTSVDEALKRLRQWKYLDDTRVALTWVQNRMESSSWGPARLGRELRHRGVEPHLVEEVLAKVMGGLTEDGLARLAAERYLRSHRGNEGQRGMRRLAGFLSRRGYSREVIGRILQEVFTGQSPGTDFENNDF